MITITRTPNPFDPGSRIVERIKWRPGLTAGAVAGAGYGYVEVNGVGATRQQQLRDHDYVAAVRVPHEGFSFVNFLLYMAASAAISYGIQALMPEPEGPTERDSEKSPTYGFSRMKNVRGENQPIPVIYGEHRVAGTIVNEFVEVNNATGESTYFALVVVSEGPIYEIAGQQKDTDPDDPLRSEDESIPNTIFLNGNPLANFHGVRAWVRLGSLDQEMVPGFEKAKRTYDVNVFLTQELGTPTSLSILDYEAGTEADEQRWDDYGYAWDVPDTGVDGTEIVVNFPQGLYRLDSDAAEPTLWTLGYRFCKLDGNGNPLLGPGYGGNLDDGWVRFPFETWTMARQGAFQLSFPVSFYDPTDYIAPVASGCLTTNSGATWSSNAYWRSGLVDSTKRPVEWSEDSVAEELSFETWIKFNGGTTANTPFEPGETGLLCLFEWTSDGNDNGVWFGFRIGYAYGKNWGWRPYMKVGKWSRSLEWPKVDIEADEWIHVIWSHKRLSSSKNRNDFFLNGETKGSYIKNMDIITPMSGTGGDARFTFGYKSTLIADADWYVRADWDETVVLARPVGQQYASQRYNGGVGQRYIEANNPDVIAGYHLDVGFGDFSAYQNTATGHGAYLFDTTGGIISKLVDPGRQRGRYRLQAMRINYDNDAEQRRRMDDAEWQLAVTWLEEAFTYPTAAYYAVEVPASEQLNTSAPTLTAVCKGRLVKIWDGVSTVAPTFTREWTKSTAWIAADMASDATYGGGRAFPEEKIDWESTEDFATDCAKRVYDGRGKRDFYRQFFDEDNNYIEYPEAFDAAGSFGWWAATSCTVTADDETAPDGTVTADTLLDNSLVALGWVQIAGGSQPSIGPEASWWCTSLFVKKDELATTWSPAIVARYGGNSVVAIWNNDTGTPVQNCEVEDWDDDWWLVKVAPYYYVGGTGNLIVQINPSYTTYSGTAADVAAHGSISIWGCYSHRGRTHLTYPDDTGASATLYMADIASDGITAQTLPGHWATGYELRLRDCADSDWDTPTTATKALEITEVEIADNRDGYRRTWIIRCKWYTDETIVEPSSDFFNLILDGFEWDNPGSNWTITGGGTLTQTYDDGTTAGEGPLDSSPLQSDVGCYTGTMLGSYAQQPTCASSTTIVARALLSCDDPATVVYLNGDDGFGHTDQGHISTDALAGGLWEAVEIELTNQGSTPTFSVHYTTSSTADACYADAIGAWYSEDASGNEPGGTVEGAEALFEYDAVHDTFQDLWTTIVECCLTARATPVAEGDRLRFKVEKSRTPVGMITAASTIVDGEYTFVPRWSDPSERANSLTIDFWDRNLNWERSTVSRDHPSVESTSDAGLIRPEPFSMRGVTRRSHLVRYADWRLAIAHNSITECEFKATPTALPYEPNDVIVLANELMPWGQSGRLMKDHSSGKNLLDGPQEFSDTDFWSYGAGLSVAENVVGTPEGDPKGDKITQSSSSQETVAQRVYGITNGISYCFSMRVRKGNGNRCALLVAQAGASGQTCLAEYTYSTDTFAGVGLPGGIQLTKVNEANSWVRLGVEIQSQGTQSITCTFIPERNASYMDGCYVYVGDAQLEADTDAPTEFETADEGLVIDRTVVLDAGGTYLARITSTETGASETADVHAWPKTYYRGDVIDIDESQLTFYPRQGDEYSIYTADQLFEGVVTQIGLNEDLSLDVRVAQYVDSAFDADDLDDDLEVYGQSDGGTTPPSPDSDDDGLIPNDPDSIVVVEGAEEASANAQRQNLRVTWEHDADTLYLVERTDVYIGLASSETDIVGEFQHVATAPGSAQTVQFTVPYEILGRRIRVAVQPVSRRGARKAARQCAAHFHEMSKYPAQPDAPTDFNAHMEGDRITFTWTPPGNAAGLVYEVRIGGASPEGGWVLAQVIGETRETSLGPTEGWANARQTNTTYYLRAKNQRGVYSDAVTLAYGARVLNATILTSSNYWYAYASEHWHDYGDGWVTDTSPPSYDPALSNLQRHADGYLEFQTGETRGTYTTAGITGAPGHFKREEPLRIEAVLIATCHNPTLVGEGRINDDGSTKWDSTDAPDRMDWPFQGNVTLEGLLQGDLPGVTIQMKLIREVEPSAPGGAKVAISTDTDAQGADGWLDYRPGLYACQSAQFRLVVTRPGTEWTVRIHEFSTATVRLPEQRHYRTPQEREDAQDLELG